MLSLLWARVQSLVEELGSHKLRSTAKKNTHTKNKISSQLREPPLHKVRRERKQFYYRISIKPECDAHHNEKNANTEILLFLYSSKHITRYPRQVMQFEVRRQVGS